LARWNEAQVDALNVKLHNLQISRTTDSQHHEDLPSQSRSGEAGIAEPGQPAVSVSSPAAAGTT
jgi:hypothetical protein